MSTGSGVARVWKVVWHNAAEGSPVGGSGCMPPQEILGFIDGLR